MSSKPTKDRNGQTTGSSLRRTAGRRCGLLALGGPVIIAGAVLAYLNTGEAAHRRHDRQGHM